MKKKTLFTILFATLAFYGCPGDGENGTGGEGGSAGTGGTGGGTGGTGGGTGGTGGGTGGTGGGTGGSGGTGGVVPGTEYAQDFESLDPVSETALSDDPNADWGVGWLVFKNVFTSGGMFKFGDGPNGAPNSTAPATPDGFSGIASGQGGPDEGDQQLSIFSDYTCCPPDEGHFGTDLVVSDVYRERVITADDVGKTITFSFSAKRGNINDPAGSSTALAFIKTLDLSLLPNDPTTNFITEDTTAIPDTWARYMISLEITADLVDQVLQFGFSSTASNSEPSGVIYDNILVVVAVAP